MSIDRLEAWLRRKRWTVALFVPLVGVAGFALRRWLGEGPWSSALGWPPLLILVNGVMALPLAFGLRGLWGRRGLAALAALALFSWLIESLGVATGWPYGRFAYAIGLEPLLFGLVPLALPLFWVPMVLDAWLLAVAGTAGLSGRGRVGAWAPWLAAPILLVLLDGIMDPGAVALGFWAWERPGPWYGVPWINFGGWLISGTVGISLAAWALPAWRVRSRLAADGLAWGTLLAFLAFWGPINGLHGQLWPALAAGLLGLRVLGLYARGIGSGSQV
ncbi:MAG: carotenoid biosynthesis protein [Caldilineae bacterium]|nr:carotenoid biosynthesis protein [Chloroflexota bacterium]MCB9175780.1 carotenoid biosynthesis protein [Caldilineae bacterium]